MDYWSKGTLKALFLKHEVLRNNKCVSKREKCQRNTVRLPSKVFIIIPFFVLHIKELKQRQLRRQREWQHLCTSITLFCTLLYCCTRLGREDSYLFSRFMDVDARQKFFLPCKRTQHCWMVHVTFVGTRCCVLFRGCCAKFETSQTFEQTTPNISFDPWSPTRMHARASRFLVHFRSVTARQWRENA